MEPSRRGVGENEELYIRPPEPPSGVSRYEKFRVSETTDNALEKGQGAEVAQLRPRGSALARAPAGTGGNSAPQVERRPIQRASITLMDLARVKLAMGGEPDIGRRALSNSERDLAGSRATLRAMASTFFFVKIST